MIERGPEDPREDRPRPGPASCRTLAESSPVPGRGSPRAGYPRRVGRLRASLGPWVALCGSHARPKRCFRAPGAERKRGEREGRRGPRPPEGRGGSVTEAVPARPARRPGLPASAKVRKPQVSARRQQPTQKIIHKIMVTGFSLLKQKSPVKPPCPFQQKPSLNLAKPTISPLKLQSPFLVEIVSLRALQSFFLYFV